MKQLPFVFFLLLWLTDSLRAEPTWYQPSGWTLGTELPASPQDVSEHKAPASQGEIVESRAGLQQGEDIFLVVHAHLPTPILPARQEAAYEGGRAMIEQGGDRLIASEEKITIAGFEGRRYVLQTKDGKRVADHRTVFLGDELFVFVYERPAEQTLSPAAERFFSKIALKRD